MAKSALVAANLLAATEALAAGVAALVEHGARSMATSCFQLVKRGHNGFSVDHAVARIEIKLLPVPRTIWTLATCRCQTAARLCGCFRKFVSVITSHYNVELSVPAFWPLSAFAALVSLQLG